MYFPSRSALQQKRSKIESKRKQKKIGKMRENAFFFLSKGSTQVLFINCQRFNRPLRIENIISFLAPSDAPLNILFTVQGSRARDWISQDFHLLSDMLEPDRSPLARGHGSVRLPSLSLQLHPKTCLSPPERAGRINSEDNKHFRSTWFCPPIFIPSRVIALGH